MVLFICQLKGCKDRVGVYYKTLKVILYTNLIGQNLQGTVQIQIHFVYIITDKV